MQLTAASLRFTLGVSAAESVCCVACTEGSRQLILCLVRCMSRVPAKSRIMYIERKAGSLTGSARIGRVVFNRTGRSIRYRDHVFRRVVGGGFKSNYIDEDSGEDYWISGCKRSGGDRLYGSSAAVEIDEDVREEYWCEIRKLPDERHRKYA